MSDRQQWYATIAKLLKRHRIRGLDAAAVMEALRRPPVRVAAGTVEAASARVASLVPRIRLLNRKIKDAHSQIEALTARLVSSEEAEPEQTGSPTPSIIGRGSPCSTIRAAAPNTPNSEPEVTAMAGRYDRSPTASSTSPAPWSNPAPPSTRPWRPKNRLDKRWGVPSPRSIATRDASAAVCD